MTDSGSDGRYAVLFVDDEEKARKYFRMAFARDFRVLTAESVNEALGILEREGEDIAVLITDQRMPGQQGVDLLRRVRSDWPGVVRMLTTAYSDLDDAIAAVNRGEILRYITKPWDLEQLRTELHHGLEFYQLRRERDLLVREKLSVRERSSHADRLRALLALSAGLAHLRHVPHAVSAWARDAAHLSQGERLPVEAMELWGLEVRETEDLIAVHRRLHALDQLANGGFPDLVGPRGLLESQGLVPEGEGPSVAGDRVLLERLVSVLRPHVGERVTIGEHVPAGMQMPGLGVDLRFQGQEGQGAWNADMLEVHLVAWHHGGTVRIEPQDDGLEIRVCLPAEPAQAVLEEPDSTWIADQFALLEP
jgi:two-component system probable response regulator PhcQ